MLLGHTTMMTSAVTFFQFLVLRPPPALLLRDQATTQVSGEGLERLLPESAGLSGPQASALVPRASLWFHPRCWLCH